MTGPLLKYVGAKWKSISDIMRLVGNPKYSEWREPFAGSAGAFFRVARCPGWLNDLDANVVKVYQMVRDDPSFADTVDAEVSRLRTKADCQTRFALACCRIADGTETAVDTVLVSRMSHKQLLNQKHRLSGPTFNPRFHFSEIALLPARVQDCRVRLQSARLTCGDYRDLLYADGKDVLVFIDPPYVCQHCIYNYNFAAIDHYRLAYHLVRCRHRFILTVGPSCLERRVYAEQTGFRCSERLYRNGLTQGQSMELVVRNF